MTDGNGTPRRKNQKEKGAPCVLTDRGAPNSLCGQFECLHILGTYIISHNSALSSTFFQALSKIIPRAAKPGRFYLLCIESLLHLMHKCLAQFLICFNNVSYVCLNVFDMLVFDYINIIYKFIYRFSLVKLSIVKIIC